MTWNFTQSTCETYRTHSGVSSGERLGYWVEQGGDWDFDGELDIVVGAPFFDVETDVYDPLAPEIQDFVPLCNVGRVYVLSGADPSLVLALIDNPVPSAKSLFGAAGAVGNFLKTDAIPDLIIGAPGYEVNGIVQGAAYLHKGVDLRSAVTPFPGRRAFNGVDGHNFGLSVEKGPALDADPTHDDFLIGGPRITDTTTGTTNGFVRAFSGAQQAGLITQLYQIDGADHDFGFSIASGNTVGFSTLDLAIGAPFAGTGGTVYIYQDPALGVTPPVATLLGANPGDHLGWALELQADLDSDGLDELLIGSPTEGNGVVRIYDLSTPATPVLVRQFNGSTSGERFGQAISSIRSY